MIIKLTYLTGIGVGNRFEVERVSEISPDHCFVDGYPFVTEQESGPGNYNVEYLDLNILGEYDYDYESKVHEDPVTLEAWYSMYMGIRKNYLMKEYIKKL